MANAITQALMGGAYTRNPLFAAPGQGAELFAKPYSTAGLFNVGNQIMQKPQMAPAPAPAPGPAMTVPFSQAMRDAGDRMRTMNMNAPGGQQMTRPTLFYSPNEGGFLSRDAMAQRAAKMRKGERF